MAPFDGVFHQPPFWHLMPFGGHPPHHPTVPVEDGQLVATAFQHRLTFATRNVRHIAQTGVDFLDPF